MGRLKGHLISKAIYGLLTSPKNERTNLFCLLFYSSWQTNQIRPFVFCENLRLANLLFEINWPLIWQWISCWVWCVWHLKFKRRMQVSGMNWDLVLRRTFWYPKFVSTLIMHNFWNPHNFYKFYKINYSPFLKLKRNT